MAVTSIIYLIIGVLCWMWYVLNSALLNNYSVKNLIQVAVFGTVFIIGFIIEGIAFLLQHLVITIN